MAEIVCRICLEQPKAPLKRVWPLEDHHGKQTYATMFTEVSGFPVFEHEPQFICEGCRLQLIDSYQFKMKCQKAQQIIMSYVEVKDEITEDINVEPSPIEAEQPLDAQVREVDIAKIINPLCKPVEITKRDAWEESLEEVEIKDEVMEEVLDSGSSNQSLTKDGDELLVEMEQEEEPTKKFRCSSCEYAVNTPRALERHLKKFHPELKVEESNFRQMKGHKTLLCPVCGKLVNSKFLNRHIEFAHERKFSQSRPKFICDLCNRRYASKPAIQDHMEVDHLKLVASFFVCSVCGLTFPKNEQLNIHRRSAHSDLYPRFKCNQCTFTSSTHGGLARHKKRHLGEEGKDFECLTCGRKFFDCYKLRAHEAIHAEKGSFACSQCSKAFKTQRRLTIHTQNVHLALKLYECPVCQRKFKSNQSMRQHATKQHPEYQLPPQGTVMRKTS